MGVLSSVPGASVNTDGYCPGDADSCYDVSGVLEVPEGCIFSCSNCVMGGSVSGGAGGDGDDSQGSGGADSDSDRGQENEIINDVDIVSIDESEDGTDTYDEDSASPNNEDESKVEFTCHFCPPGTSFQRKWAKISGFFKDDDKPLKCRDALPAGDRRTCQAAREALAKDEFALGRCGYCVPDSDDVDSTSPEKVSQVAGSGSGNAAEGGKSQERKQGQLCTLCPNGQKPSAPPNKPTKFGVTCGHISRLLLVGKYSRKKCRRERRKYKSACSCPEAPRAKYDPEEEEKEKEEHEGEAMLAIGNPNNNTTGEATSDENGGEANGTRIDEPAEERTTASPSAAPTAPDILSTARPITDLATTAPPISDDGIVEVNFTVGLYNSLGLTARDVLDWAAVPGTRDAVSYRAVIERALRLVFEAKYPSPAGALVSAQGEAAPAAVGDEGRFDVLQGQGGRENYHRLRARRGDGRGRRIRGRRLTPRSRRDDAPDLALIDEPTLISGTNVICPPSVPRIGDSASGAVNACQDFTAALLVSAVQPQDEGYGEHGEEDFAQPVDEDVVRGDVVKAFDDAQRDGNLTSVLRELLGVAGVLGVQADTVDARATQTKTDADTGSDGGSGGGDDDADDSDSGSSPGAAGRSADGSDNGGGSANTAAIVGGAVGGVLGLACCCLGIFARPRKTTSEDDDGGWGGKEEERLSTQAEDDNG